MIWIRISCAVVAVDGCLAMVFEGLWYIPGAGGPSSQELGPREEKALAVYEMRMEEHNKLQASPYVVTALLCAIY